tara:strand:- start:684 stop:1466 length:783 start_codon:yes stop_codon:yes gene_type:complete
MKQILITIALLFSVNVNSQYHKYFYFSVPAAEVSAFLDMEAEHYGKVLEKAVQGGAINGWAVYRKIDSNRHTYNFYSYINFGSLEQFTNSGIGKYFGERLDESGSPSLISSAIEKHGSYMEFSATFYRHDTQQNKNREGFRYLKHNYAKVQNVGAFIQAQINNWGPFIKKVMDNGKINQSIWATSSMLNPTGNGFDWNVKTIDGYQTLKDVYDPGSGSSLDFSEANIGKINETFPNGWYKQTLWERIIWIDSDGNLSIRN